MPSANIIGSGPNGLAAAITLAQHGFAAAVYERNPQIGGGLRTLPLTLPGFRHDLCSAVYPLGIASPFFRTLPLAQHGLRWIEPPAPLAHPLDDGSAITLEHSLADTAAALGPDGRAWTELHQPLANAWEDLLSDILGPIAHLPRHPLLLARFGLQALQPAATLARRSFSGPRARALFAGCAAHSVLPLTAPGSSAIALVMAAAAHTTGWPIAAGGAQSLAEALAAHLTALGGRIHTGTEIHDLGDLPPADLTLADLSPRQLVSIAKDRLPSEYRARLGRFRYGPGAFKLDWALSSPIPWKNADCARAATVHLGGTLEEIAAWEAAVFRGRMPPPEEAKPFLILVQPSLFDPSRAPEGKHTAWAYCHVPHASAVDPQAMTAAIERQVARFAPGFQDCILARSVHSPAALEAANPNLIGGDISGGAMTLRQLIFRPTATLYRTPSPHLYLCSASTPPGGGVHGMSGYLAAKLALSRRR
jgi:phytoene dehydrogenase-like protein